DGGLATFTAAADGTPAPTVQWQVSTDGGSSFVDAPGATDASYSFLACACDEGKLFRAVFANDVGSATTDPATLTVLLPPVVTLAPASQDVAEGDAATFTAAASGNPAPSVQWDVAVGGGDLFEPIEGATSSTLTIT